MRQVQRRDNGSQEKSALQTSVSADFEASTFNASTCYPLNDLGRRISANSATLQYQRVTDGRTDRQTADGHVNYGYYSALLLGLCYVDGVDAL